MEEQKEEADLIECLDNFFIEKLRISKTIDRRALFNVLNILNDSASIFSVKKLASQMNMHVRTLERLFATDVGLSPKEILRIRRFILLKDHVIRNPQIHWPDLILNCGFYDQAHMNHEISKVTNMKPFEFFQMARALSC